MLSDKEIQLLTYQDDYANILDIPQSQVSLYIKSERVTGNTCLFAEAT